MEIAFLWRETYHVVSEMPLSGKEPYLTFGGINENNIAQLRLLNDVIFPVRYHDKFYADVLSLAPEFAKYAYWNGFVVGAVCCRLESYEGGKRRLYIMTLGVLAAYRGHGIGSKLLQSVLDAVAKHDGVVEVYLHVQTSNDDALNFYTKRHGFVRKELVRNYYKRIDPPDCYILARPLGEGDVHADPALAEA